MTDKPTAEQIALAREIAEHLVHGMATENEVRCALAAIIETTERAAKWLQFSPPEHSDEGGCPFDKAATALRNGDHLK